MAGEPFFSRMIARGTAFSMGNLSSLKETQAILGGEYVFSGAITRPDVIAKRPQMVQKVVTALVKASHFIETKTPEEIAGAVPAVIRRSFSAILRFSSSGVSRTMSSFWWA